MAEKTILVWFRNDLRIHDNEILLEAVRKADKVLPVYCFDPYYFQKKPDGSHKTGNIRARFLLESVENLRKNLRAFGGELIIRIGNPAVILPQLAGQYNVNEVYHHREVAREETTVSEQVEAALWKIKLNLKHFIGHTLYHKEDLPFPIKDIPNSFAIFKKKIERDSTVRTCLATPESIAVPEIDDPGKLPALHELGLEQPYDDPRTDFVFEGGENAALEQLQQFLLKIKLKNDYKSPRHSTRPNNSSKLSPWLALGCISLRHVYWEVINHQDVSDMGCTNQLLLDLLWRDYFRFMFKKHGQNFIVNKNLSRQTNEANTGENLVFENWKNGNTGVPIVDAIMHELNATGYISNYNRQIVAQSLIKDMEVEWQKGATYFEEKLIDYSPASNWGNWAFIAGVNDAQVSKYNMVSKAITELETKSEFVKTWSPALKETGYENFSTHVV